MKLESIQNVRMKQIIAWSLGIVGLLALMVIVLKLQENPTVAEEDAAINIRKNLKPLISEEQGQDIWIEKSEKKIKILEDTLKEQNETLKRLASIIESEREKPTKREKAFPGNYPPKEKLPPPIIDSFGINTKIPVASNIIPAQPSSGIIISPQPSSEVRPIERQKKEKEKNSIRVVMGTPQDKKKEPEPEKEEKKNHNKKTYLSATTFISTTLLSGLDAPTSGQAQTNPHPVLLLVKDLSSMPQNIQKNAKECRILASGYGSLSSERAYIRGETITCEMKNGTFIEKPIKGYIAGEDGKNGARGRVVEKEGKYIAYALAAGFAKGVSNGFKSSTNTIMTSPLGAVSSADPNKIFESGAYSGAETAMDMLAKKYISKADEIFAIIEIDASRTVDFVVIEGVELI